MKCKIDNTLVIFCIYVYNDHLEILDKVNVFLMISKANLGNLSLKQILH